MAIDEPHEERLAGAITSEEEEAGIQPVIVTLMDGAVELEAEAAPAGDVRVTVMNRGSRAVRVALTAQAGLERHDTDDSEGSDRRSTIASWSSIEPGGSGSAVVKLAVGSYTFTSCELDDGRALGSATLVVQPQEGLADASRRPALGAPDIEA